MGPTFIPSAIIELFSPSYTLKRIFLCKRLHESHLPAPSGQWGEYPRAHATSHGQLCTSEFTKPCMLGIWRSILRGWNADEATMIAVNVNLWRCLSCIPFPIQTRERSRGITYPSLAPTLSVSCRLSDCRIIFE